MKLIRFSQLLLSASFIHDTRVLVCKSDIEDNHAIHKGQPGYMQII